MTWTTIPTWVGLVMAGAGFVGGAAAGILVGAALAASRQAPDQLVISFRHLRRDGWSFRCDSPFVSGGGYDTLPLARLAAAQALAGLLATFDEPDAALRSS